MCCTQSVTHVCCICVHVDTCVLYAFGHIYVTHVSCTHGLMCRHRCVVRIACGHMFCTHLNTYVSCVHMCLHICVYTHVSTCSFAIYRALVTVRHVHICAHTYVSRVHMCRRAVHMCTTHMCGHMCTHVTLWKEPYILQKSPIYCERACGHICVVRV